MLPNVVLINVDLSSSFMESFSSPPLRLTPRQINEGPHLPAYPSQASPTNNPHQQFSARCVTKTEVASILDSKTLVIKFEF